MGNKYRAFCLPAVSVGCGAFAVTDGLANLVVDILEKIPIDTYDKIEVGLGAGLVMYGIGLLEKAKSNYN